jgi:branched-chain amino acid transport system ATP-binding protein
LLELEDVRVAYGRVEAVRGVSLHVDEGELVGVIGANGAGKTTTLHAIAGLLRPSAGTIRYAGQPIGRATPEELVRRGIALVPEGRHVFARLSVRDNLRVGSAGRADRAGLAAATEQVLELFPALVDLLDRPAGKLSGGEQQQLAIGRALLSGPRLLLLDEPSLGLAPIVVERIFERLERLRSTGMSLLVVEQNARQMIAVADRTYVMRTGRIAAHGTATELLDGVDLAAAYLGGPAATEAS